MPVARPAAALVAGVDVGSTAAKAVVLDGATRAVLGVAVTPTGWNPRETGQAVLDAALREAGTRIDRVARVVGTGYGRISLPFLHRTVTEIT
ncbi:MAG TPA: 2-hydroxyglutaryl-CoA dehydratase, partial [Desulfovibrio sp.]|nr:2-hydroxyglutaryl-CoA dehydratase [Desulfovibrio sp.]